MKRKPDHEAAIHRAKLALGFGDVYGFAKPCGICGSRLSRRGPSGVRCWWHFDAPIQFDIVGEVSFGGVS
jgi:hypothetical protein